MGPGAGAAGHGPLHAQSNLDPGIILPGVVLVLYSAHQGLSVCWNSACLHSASALHAASHAASVVTFLFKNLNLFALVLWHTAFLDWQKHRRALIKQNTVNS